MAKEGGIGSRGERGTKELEDFAEANEDANRLGYAPRTAACCNREHCDMILLVMANLSSVGRRKVIGVGGEGRARAMIGRRCHSVSAADCRSESI